MLNAKSQILTIHTDGGSRGNPGPAAIGVDSCLFQLSECIGLATNNTAEYTAVIRALEYLIANKLPVSEINFVLDSELVVKQLNRLYKVKDSNIIILFNRVQTLLLNLQNQYPNLTITFAHVRREQNKIADSLVNKALDSQK